MSCYTELAEKATPLPWEARKDRSKSSKVAFWHVGNRYVKHVHAWAKGDSEFIVALVNAAPYIERLWKAADLSLDTDPCSFDHHGYCQTHGCGDMGDQDTPHCPTAVGRSSVESLRSLFGEEQK